MQLGQQHGYPECQHLKKKEDEEQEPEHKHKQEQRSDHTSNYPSYHFFSSPRWISHLTNKAVLLQGQGYAIRMLYTAPRVCDFPLHNIVVSRHPLARLVGCSASTLSTTYVPRRGQNKYTRLSYTLPRDPETPSRKTNKENRYPFHCCVNSPSSSLGFSLLSFNNYMNVAPGSFPAMLCSAFAREGYLS
jgi:hypothetical protein